MFLLPNMVNGGWESVYKPHKCGSLFIKSNSMKTVSKYENAQHNHKKSFKVLREEIESFFSCKQSKNSYFLDRDKINITAKISDNIYNSG